LQSGGRTRQISDLFASGSCRADRASLADGGECDRL
jgi:hypothetical protein